MRSSRHAAPYATRGCCGIGGGQGLYHICINNTRVGGPAGRHCLHVGWWCMTRSVANAGLCFEMVCGVGDCVVDVDVCRLAGWLARRTLARARERRTPCRQGCCSPLPGLDVCLFADHMPPPWCNPPTHPPSPQNVGFTQLLFAASPGRIQFRDTVSIRIACLPLEVAMRNAAQWPRARDAPPGTSTAHLQYSNSTPSSPLCFSGLSWPEPRCYSRMIVFGDTWLDVPEDFQVRERLCVCG